MASSRRSWVVVDEVIGGRVVCLCFLTFLPLGDDNGAGVATNVDDVTKVVIGVVVGFSSFFLVSLCYTLVTFSMLLVANLALLLLDVIDVLFFHLDGDHDAWRRI